MRLHLVWNHNRTECVGFTDKDDAKQAAGIKGLSAVHSTLAYEFREVFALQEPKEKFTLQTIDVPRPGIPIDPELLEKVIERLDIGTTSELELAEQLRAAQKAK